jgi:hypothetical protein
MLLPTDDGPLPGGTANHGRVIRVGATVHRPVGAHTPAVHALLGQLAATGFTGAPRVIGVDGATEILGYLEGAAAIEPVPDWALTDSALTSVGELLRAYHRHASGFDGSQLRWQRPVPERWRGGLVTHNDSNPANVIFRDGRAVALIDFDLAAPGSRAWELAMAACFWVPLRADEDVTDDRRNRVVERFGLLLDSYGADAVTRLDVARAVRDANRWIAAVIEDAANTGHPAFGRLWQRDMELHRRADAWLVAHVDELLAAASRAEVGPR